VDPSGLLPWSKPSIGGGKGGYSSYGKNKVWVDKNGAIDPSKSYCKSGNDKQKKGTSGNNKDQNQQFKDATKGLTKDQKRKIHDLISGQNYSYKEIKDLARDYFD